MNNKNDYNKKKSDQLGMPFGTANGRLRKMILFDLAKRLDLDYCYRCTLIITNIDNFTIEHKKAWLDVNPALFWDLDNIAFSHLACNISAAKRVKVSLCYKCKKNPARRNKKGVAIACTPCNSELKRNWRKSSGKN